jgi:uncharacterized membrane-anchored protein YitT (DUF2179 family)
MKIRKTIKEYSLISFGVLLLSVGVSIFKIPNGFSTGGVSGIGTVLGKLTPLSPALWISSINILLLILGFIFLGRQTGVKTVYCSLLFSALTWLFELFLPLSAPLTDQPLLELIYAMLLTSIGSALMFFYDASSGGTDIIALILKKYTNMNVGRALLCTDFVIAASSFFVFGVETGLFSLLGLFAKALLVDSVIDNLYSFKYFIVITTEGEKIEKFITDNLHHGATAHTAYGVFTGKEKVMIHTVCRRMEAILLRKKIKEIDPEAFTIITTSSEIIGRGFRGV